MKIYIASSKHFYDKIEPIKEQLEENEHIITLPNSYDDPLKEEKMKKLGKDEHIKFKQEMMRKQEEKIKSNDAILVLNFNKASQENYIGGATFMEIIKAWELNKKIFLYNPIPESIFEDELTAINPIIINQDLELIKEKQLEVEIRSFITENQYDKLIDFLEEEGKYIGDDIQETIYFNIEQDLRLQRNSSGTKLWLKKGKMHDEAREEIEINGKHEDFEKYQEIFQNLGYKEEIKWFRERKHFTWKKINVYLDKNRGYGLILELEKKASEFKIQETLKELKQALEELGIDLTAKEIFEKRYKDYKKNWRELVIQ